MAATYFEPHEAPFQSQDHSPQRILVVDDDADIRQLETEILTGSGYQVDTAEDGAAAWAALRFNSYDLLITDNDMPNLSGVELLENLLLDHNGMPVILVSGTLLTEELDRHPWLQVEATLHKPYSVADFLGAVETVLGVAEVHKHRQPSVGGKSAKAAVSLRGW